MPDDDTAPPAERLVNVLMREHHAGRLHYYGPDRAGRYRFETEGHARRLDPDSAWAWLRGRDVGAAAGPAAPPAGVDELAPIRRVLVHPTLGDQCRTAVLAAMEHAGIGITELADRAGRTRHAVRAALKWGSTARLSMRMAEMMIDATGAGVRIVATDEPGEPGVGDLGRVDVGPAGAGGLVEPALPEPAGIGRMRAVAVAHEAGICRLVSPLDPDAAYRAVRYVLDVGGVERRIHAGVLVGWLTGVADGRGERVIADALSAN